MNIYFYVIIIKSHPWFSIDSSKHILYINSYSYESIISKIATIKIVPCIIYVPRAIICQKIKLEFIIIIKLSSKWSERQSVNHMSELV